MKQDFQNTPYERYFGKKIIPSAAQGRGLIDECPYMLHLGRIIQQSSFVAES